MSDVPPEPHTARPPDQCPDVYKKKLGNLINCEASLTMQKHKIPWHLITAMILADYTTDKELAERWLSKAVQHQWRHGRCSPENAGETLLNS